MMIEKCLITFILCTAFVSNVYSSECFECTSEYECVGESWRCDGMNDCLDGSEEIGCNVTEVADVSSEKGLCIQWFLDRRSDKSVNKWGLQLPRTAVVLYLSDSGFFAPENKTGQEIRYELTIHLLSILNRHVILRTEQLALYVHALLVSCLNPRNFYGYDMVSDLRKRVDFSKYTSPLSILVLCNAKAPMTDQDVQRLNQTYFSKHRTYWTEIQALSTMALYCISSKSNISVDPELLQQWIDSAKLIPLHKNFRTITLVIQMLLGTNYSGGFDWQNAVGTIRNISFISSSNFFDKYYLTPILSNKGLTAVDTRHCGPISDNEDLLFAPNQNMVTVRYTIWADKEEGLGKSWRIRMPSSSTLYDVIMKVHKGDTINKVEFNDANEKPYVKSVSGVDEDPETGHYWFTYERNQDSDNDPQLTEDSPVDINIRDNHEYILWYRNGIWNTNFESSGQLP